jgi:uncharacterized protein YjbI with pentapeptide repeats
MNDFFDKPEYLKTVFKDIVLTTETLRDIVFEECTFEKCNFLDCKFYSTRFEKCTFTKCTINGVKFRNCIFDEADFKNSKIIATDFSEVKDFESVHFEDCILDYSSFYGVDARNLSIVNGKATEADFTEGKFKEASFERTDLEKAIFHNTDLTRASFKHAKNYTIDIKTNKLKKAKFSIPEVLTLLQTLDIEVE